jgi:RimJ/RimL family protein N-acetyltransferase
MGINRVHAYHMLRNPASGRVLARLGFREEGVLRQRVRKWGVFEDVVLQALLKEDWLEAGCTCR